MFHLDKGLPGFRHTLARSWQRRRRTGIQFQCAGLLLRPGAIGASGAPGGEKDEACVKAGIEKVAAMLK